MHVLLNMLLCILRCLMPLRDGALINDHYQRLAPFSRAFSVTACALYVPQVGDLRTAAALHMYNKKETDKEYLRYL